MYTDQKILVQSGVVSFASTGNKFEYLCGLVPMILRRVGAVITVATTTTAPVLAINRRPTAGVATGEVVVDTITLVVASPNGKVYFVENLNTKITPGESIGVDVNTAAAAGSGVILMEFDPVWDNRENQTDMVLSA